MCVPDTGRMKGVLLRGKLDESLWRNSDACCLSALQRIAFFCTANNLGNEESLQHMFC